MLAAKANTRSSLSAVQAKNSAIETSDNVDACTTTEETAEMAELFPKNA